MPAFPLKLGARNSNKDVLDFIRHFCPWAVEWKFWWRQTIHMAGPRRVFAPDADGSQELDLNALFPNNSFPENVDLLPGAKIRRITDVAGGAISAFTVAMGGTFDAGVDADGLVTASSVFTGQGAGYINTPAAANYARRYESAFAPTLTLASTNGNIDDVEAGEFEVLVPFTPLRSY